VYRAGSAALGPVTSLLRMAEKTPDLIADRIRLALDLVPDREFGRLIRAVHEVPGAPLPRADGAAEPACYWPAAVTATVKTGR
jgi:hypothetical protein